jgi:hypothetical protein
MVGEEGTVFVRIVVVAAGRLGANPIVDCRGCRRVRTRATG